MSCSGVAFHRVREPRACIVVTRATLAACCQYLLNRIESEKNRQRSVLLFMDPKGSAYLIHEDHPTARTWTLTRLPDLVGLYRHRTRKAVPPTLEGLAEDIAEHMGWT